MRSEGYSSWVCLCVCLSVCLLSHISPTERLFVLKTLSRTQRATKVKKFVGIFLKRLCSRVKPQNMSEKANMLIIPTYPMSAFSSLVNQPYFLGGGENTSGHTCTTSLAGRNFGYVIIQITLTAKTNFRYVKNALTLRSNFGIQNKLALYVLQVLPSEVETEVRKGELIMNRQQATSGTIVPRFFHAKTVATSSDASHRSNKLSPSEQTSVQLLAAQLELSSARYLGRLPSRISISNYASCVTRIRRSDWL